ncbi:hypothetical protein BDN71DRAFT_1512484 [Pleurotus eryngii]|uniref:Uncharacterized protein n=1 Tax=Pleurotus eryngii TaxID=5323 RepID=A0A9P6D2Y8_PLEER|nr:hypothetical protein BDN71DRAFT_1512484 [Pleurotus eryngii]
MRRSWDTVPIALLHRELEYVLSTISASVAMGHIVTLGPIVQVLAKGLEKDSITPASFQDSHELRKACLVGNISITPSSRGRPKFTFAPHSICSDDHSMSEGMGRTAIRKRSLLLVCYMAQAAIPITSPPCDQCIERLNIMMQMMFTLAVVMNDRMMDIVAHRQEVAALFDIYEAVIYKEADNADKAETQQNTTKLDDEIQHILDNNKPAPKHTNRKKATKAMEDLRCKNHTLIDLINKGTNLSLEEVFTEFHLVPNVSSLETHNRYFRTLPSRSKCSGDTLDQAVKIRNVQFPLIFNLQPLTPIQPKDDGDIPHITLANRPHDCLASVFQTPKLFKPLAKAELTGFAALDCAQSSLCRSKPTMYIPPLAGHNSPEYVPSGSDTLIPPIIPVADILESDDESFQSLGGTLSSIIGKKLASEQASAQPSAGSASGSDASLSGESAMEYEPHSVSWPDIDDTDNARSLGGSSTDTQSLPPQNVIHPHMPHNKLPTTSTNEASLGGESTEDLSSDDKIADDHPHIPHHASLTTSDDEVSLGGQLTKDPSSNDEMANDESMEENTLGINLSRHNDEADNSHTFSMVEMQANISNIPSSLEVGRMGSPIDEVDDTYLEYSDDSDGDVDIPDDVRAYLQTSHTLGFQLRYQHVHFEHIPDAEFADDVL